MRTATNLYVMHKMRSLDIPTQQRLQSFERPCAPCILCVLRSLQHSTFIWGCGKIVATDLLLQVGSGGAGVQPSELRGMNHCLLGTNMI